MSKATNDKLRAKWVEALRKTLADMGEEVLVTASNELCIPAVDEAGEDQYVCFTVKIPTGSRDGDGCEEESREDRARPKDARREGCGKGGS